MNGRLVLVGTPLGNLEDLSPRVRRSLEEADLILCEDTRHSGRLLRALGIDRPLRSHHAHNEHAAVDDLLRQLREGRQIALISDAGMPLLSDPGLPLVQAVIEAGLELDVVPGPSAGITALVLSGFPALPHAMFGFLPVKGRRAAIEPIARWPHTALLFLSPHRGGKELEALAEACGPERPAVLTRELTKLHQDVLRGTLGELAARIAADPPRGEWTLVLGPAPAGGETIRLDEAVFEAKRIAAQEGLGHKAAAQHVASRHGLAWRSIYRALLAGE